MLTIPEEAWYRSSRTSGASNCVEVAHGPGWTAVRDSKNPTGPMLVITKPEWQAFINDAEEAGCSGHRSTRGPGH